MTHMSFSVKPAELSHLIQRLGHILQVNYPVLGGGVGGKILSKLSRPQTKAHIIVIRVQNLPSNEFVPRMAITTVFSCSSTKMLGMRMATKEVRYSCKQKCARIEIIFFWSDKLTNRELLQFHCRNSHRICGHRAH